MDWKNKMGKKVQCLLFCFVIASEICIMHRTFLNVERKTKSTPVNIQGGNKLLRLPGVEPGSIAWKAIILTVGLQTLL